MPMSCIEARIQLPPFNNNMHDEYVCPSIHVRALKLITRSTHGANSASHEQMNE